MVLFIVLWLFLFFPGVGGRISGDHAQARTEDSFSQEIESVIRQQLDAFGLNDYETAYGFASKEVKRQLSRSQFEERVRTDSPQIIKSIRVTFEKIVFDPDRIHATALLQVTGFNHKKVTAEYRMVLEEGEWKIDGMTVLPIRTFWFPFHSPQVWRELVRKSQREARAFLGVPGKARGSTRSGSVAAFT